LLVKSIFHTNKMAKSSKQALDSMIAEAKAMGANALFE